MGCQCSKHAKFQRGYTQFDKALLRKPIHPFEVFKLCDRSGSGRICWEDFAAVCPLLGEPPSLDVFKAADTNHDGFVDYEEFEAMLRAGTCFGRPIRVDFIRIKQGDHLKAAASKGASTNAKQSEADSAANNLYEPAVEVGAKPTELATESELRAQLFGLAQSEADSAANNLYEPAVEVGAKPTELAKESELSAQPGVVQAQVVSVQPPTATVIHSVQPPAATVIHGAGTPTIVETCDVLRRQLGLAEAPVCATLAAACQALGVPQDGTIGDQADRCRAALGR